MGLAVTKVALTGMLEKTSEISPLNYVLSRLYNVMVMKLKFELYGRVLKEEECCKNFVNE